MDPTSTGGKVQTWAKERFGGLDEVTTRQLREQSRDSGLPEEARTAIAGLPDRSWSVDGAIHSIVDVLETRAGGGARGDANLAGKGGYGRSV